MTKFPNGTVSPLFGDIAELVDSHERTQAIIATLPWPPERKYAFGCQMFNATRWTIAQKAAR